MRASRLVSLLGLLQARGRMTAGQLAAELEVSPRTVLRDIEALGAAGIPVYAMRGCQGGFALVDGFRAGPRPAPPRPGQPGPGQPRPGQQRARLRISPRGRRLAALLGGPALTRARRSVPAAPGRENWGEAWMPLGAPETAVLDVLALGGEAEVLHPAALREMVAAAARLVAVRHAGPPAG